MLGVFAGLMLLHVVWRIGWPGVLWPTLVAYLLCCVLFLCYLCIVCFAFRNYQRESLLVQCVDIISSDYLVLHIYKVFVSFVVLLRIFACYIFFHL